MARGAALVVSGAYIAGSVMLWVAYFMGLVIFYALINWMPLLFKDAGIDPGHRNADLGPVSARRLRRPLLGLAHGPLQCEPHHRGLLCAHCRIRLCDRPGSRRQPAQLMVLVFLAGVLMNTAQSSMPSLAAAFYPTEARVTGVAWMMGVGRFGGIAGSLLVAELARRNLSFGQIFAVVAIPGVLAMAALLIKQFTHPHIGVAAVREEATLTH